MDRLPSSRTQLRLEAQQTLLAAARAGTWIHVRSGVLIAQPPPRWLGECMVAPTHRLATGAGLLIDEDGWWRFVADHGPVDLQCVCAAGPSAPAWLARVAARGLQALREITRRLRPS